MTLYLKSNDLYESNYNIQQKNSEIRDKAVKDSTLLGKDANTT